MDTLWIGVAVAAVLLIIATLWFRRAAAPAERSRPPAAPRPADAVVTVTPPAAARQATPEPALADFRLVEADELPADRREAYLTVFRQVPRPPRLMQHLLSPELFNAASSAELVELISAEPLIAAQVLASVNSSFYGLPRGVTSISQAVSYLGLNGVRILGLRYLMRSSFQADSAERRQRLDELWNASALASELVQRLPAPLPPEQRGLVVSAVVLSFLGRLTVAATTPRGILATIPRHDPLQRLLAEQAKLGLCAAQIGRLLMFEWGLPHEVIECAAAIEALMLQPPGQLDEDLSCAVTLAYACVRIGERLASGELRSLSELDLDAEQGPEWFHWQAHHAALPELAALPQWLQAPELDALLQRQLGALRTPQAQPRAAETAVH